MRQPAYSIEDLRRAAARRLPPTIFDTIEGGSGDEEALRRNRAALSRLAVVPRMLKGFAAPDTSVSILGTPSPLPLVVGPTGMSGIYWPGGELAMARACAANGLIYVLSSVSSVSLEDVAGASDGRKWFQLYPFEDEAINAALVDRARTAGYEALVVTVDTPRIGMRLRDLRNGLRLPPRISPAFIASMLGHPSWSWPYLKGYRPSLANLADGANGRSGLALPAMKSSVSWPDMERFRRRWDGPFVVKGIMHRDDCVRAAEAGASAVVISNHGGRQLDCAPSTAAALRFLRPAPDGLEIYADGGVRSGSDILKFAALGAAACLAGRAPLYGLAAAGESGAAAALEILARELRGAMALAGCAGLGGADGACELIEEFGGENREGS